MAGRCLRAALVAVLLGTLTAGCAGAGQVKILETGSTLLYPLFNLWSAGYRTHHPAVQITTQGTGSGTGIAEAAAGVAQIGASDAYMSEAQLRHSPELLNIPLAISAQLISYHLPGLDERHLKLSGPVLAGIYTGRILRWDDPAIRALNPGLPLPDRRIIPVHRTDGSGDTFIFTQYLSFSDPSWDRTVHYGTTVGWPRVPGGVGMVGNPGVVQALRHTPYAIGYVGISWLDQVRSAHLGYAALANRTGSFVLPTRSAILAGAGALAPRTPPDERLSLVLAPGASSYPLINYEYAVVSRRQADPAVGRTLRDFLAWAVDPRAGSAPGYLDQVHFLPLPAAVRRLTLAQVNRVGAGPTLSVPSRGWLAAAGGLALLAGLYLLIRRRSRRFWQEAAMRWGSGLFALSVPFFLLAMLTVLLVSAWPSILYNGWGFFHRIPWDMGNLYTRQVVVHHGVTAPPGAAYGMLVFLVGTLATSVLALVLAVPVALGVAVYLTQFAPRNLTGLLSSLVELLSGVPSVVYGLWGWTVVVPLVGGVLGPWLARLFAGVPFLRGPVGTGEGLLTAGLVLAVMVIPIIAAISRDVLAQVPGELKEQGRSLGVTDWELIWHLLLPYARPGILGAVVLGLGRALGETMAVLMISGNALNYLPGNLYSPVGTMAATIVAQLDSAMTDPTGMAVHALAELALVLFAITLLVNVLVPLVMRGFAPALRERRLVPDR